MESGLQPSEIWNHLPFEPTERQIALLAVLTDFTKACGPRDLLIINGYAGSGKTSIMGAYIKALAARKIKTVTLAPTGRAAKVAADFAGGRAFTIHKHIFRADSSTPDARFFLAPNPDRNTIYIVDEASLITDYPSNSLLMQLMRYVYSGEGNNIIFVGDEAQLPPVGMETSPAMDPQRYRKMGMDPIHFTLDTPMRQTEGSGILSNATLIRRRMTAPPGSPLPELLVKGFDDVEVVSSADLADSLSDSWSAVGGDETIIITRSNSRANKYNQAIRNLVMMAESPLQRGDRIVVAKNDYYWGKINKLKGFIANGDMAEVVWVGKTEKMYGRFFTDVELLLSSSQTNVGAKIMLRSLACEGPAIPRDEMERFFTHVLAEQEGELTERIKKAIEDPYYNALQCKYGYCVTCHKAQGGQWENVYIDMSGIDPTSVDESFYRWLYTAITRAKSKLFFINPTLPIA